MARCVASSGATRVLSSPSRSSSSSCASSSSHASGAPRSRAMSSLLSEEQFHRLRANSRTTLRFGKSLQEATELHSSPDGTPMRQLCRLLLSAVPLAPAPTLYLSHFAPAFNAFSSLLALLACQPLSQPLHNLLLHVAVHPHVTQHGSVAALSVRDSVALNFVRAVVMCPPRIPIQLRNSLRSMYAPEKVNHIALVASFGAFYATIASLLGLSDEAPSPHTRCLDGELRQLLSNANADLASVLDPSEMSLPTTTTYSRASSAFSFSNRFSSTAKSHFFRRLAHPLRVKLARYAVHHSERTSWLSSIPSTRRAQNDFVCTTMGFVPEYLTAIRSQSHRSVFIYLINSILLSECDCLSTAIKNLACYILARSSENSVLTAHAAFLANRFGALDSQLSMCMDVPKLQAMQREYALLDSTQASPTSSIMTLSDQLREHDILDATQPEPELTRRSRHADMFRFPEFSSGVAFEAPNSSREGSARVSYHQDGDDSDPEQLLFDDDSFVQSEPSLFRRGLAKLTRKDSDRRSTMKRSLRRTPQQTQHPQRPRYEEFDTPINSWESGSSSASSSSTTASDGCQVAVTDSGHSLFALSDNPEVPNVSGLNSFAENNLGDYGDDDIEIEYAEDYSVFKHTDASNHRQGHDGEEDIDLSTFSREEVAFLLLAHEVVQASLNNSRVCTKYADVAPSPLISAAQATIMHKLFEPEAIMEQVSVIATFSFLQRWLECFPYKPGALEAPVRRFAQSSIAHSINLGAVGQRCNSRYAEDLREQTGRSLRLPRHTVAPRCES